MHLKQFKEYKAIIEEAIRQSDIAENIAINCSAVPHDIAIFLTTSRARECIILAEGVEIQVLKRIQHSPNGVTSFKTYDVINLAEPGSVLRLGIAIKDLLGFSYWSKADELG